MNIGIKGHEVDLADLVVREISNYVENNDRLLDPDFRNENGDFSKWQPAQFYLDPIEDQEKINALRRDSFPNISIDLRLAIAGNLITEEGLPGYMKTIMSFDHFQEHEVLSNWTNMWIAEEQKHGDLLSHFAYISGLFNLVELNRDREKYNIAGIDLGVPRSRRLDSDDVALFFLLDLASSFAYVSFQEKSTHTSHRNVQKFLREIEGKNSWSAEIMKNIALDEAKHYGMYQRVFHKILEASPDYALVALKNMVKGGFHMPSMKSLDERKYKAFELSAARSRVFGPVDYFNSVKKIIDSDWGETIRNLRGLSYEGEEAQEYLGNWPSERMKKIYTKAQNRFANDNEDLSEHPWLKRVA